MELVRKLLIIFFLDIPAEEKDEIISLNKSIYRFRLECVGILLIDLPILCVKEDEINFS